MMLPFNSLNLEQFKVYNYPNVNGLVCQLTINNETKLLAWYSSDTYP